MKEVHLEFYAQFREQAGVRQTQWKTDKTNLTELYKDVAERYGFNLQPDNIRVARNQKFAPWNSPVVAGDTVSFLPPVTGG